MELKISRKKSLLILYLLIPLISIFMHWRVFNLDMVGFHAWRQTQTQTNINNFYDDDFNILNPKINLLLTDDGTYRMEFPLMQWFTAGLYKLFGQHIFISRLFNFLLGLLSIFGLYHLIHRLFDNRFLGLTAAWALCFSPLFYYYTINPMPDNLALTATILGLYFFHRWQRQKKLFHAFISGIFLSVSFASKLPFVFYTLIPLSIYILNLKNKSSVKESLWAALIQFACFLPAFAWYLWVIPQWSNGIVSGIANSQNYDMRLIFDYLLHHLISTLPEVIVNYAALLFFILGIIFSFKKKLFSSENGTAYTILFIGLMVYFIFEINMIEKVHDYYLMPFLIPSILLIITGIRYFPWPRIMVLILLLIMPLTAWLRINHRWDTDKPGFNKDLLVYKEQLREAVPDTARVIYIEDPSPSISLYYLDKKGWTFRIENFSETKLKQLISDQQAVYLFSDERSVEQMPYMDNYLLPELGRYGSIRIYPLKQGR